MLNYIRGVGGQNAANTQFARTRGVDRSDFFEAVATAWSQLDPDEYPFTRSVTGQLRAHNDRVDFLAGIDLILSGIESQSTNTPKRSRSPTKYRINIVPMGRAV